jgi:hypothetical protein
MTFGRTQRKLLAIVTAAAAAAAVVAAPGEARAQATSGDVSGTGKGIVGGGLLGAEVVDLTLGAIGVQRAWPYLVLGAMGAAGGAAGGYFVEQDSPDGAVYMLAGGMALVIPTLVVALNATSYHPPETDQTEPVQNQPSGEPVKAGVSITSKAEQRKHVARVPVHYALSLVDFYRGTLALGMPAVELRPRYTMQEMAMFGVEQRTEVRVPLFQAAF